jgi:hypothetical protein
MRGVSFCRRRVCCDCWVCPRDQAEARREGRRGGRSWEDVSGSAVLRCAGGVGREGCNDFLGKPFPRQDLLARISLQFGVQVSHLSPFLPSSFLHPSLPPALPVFPLLSSCASGLEAMGRAACRLCDLTAESRAMTAKVASSMAAKRCDARDAGYGSALAGGVEGDGGEGGLRLHDGALPALPVPHLPACVALGPAPP